MNNTQGHSVAVATSRSAAFRQKQIEMLFGQLPLILLADTVAGIFLFSILFINTGTLAAVAWLLVLLLLTAARAVMAFRIKQHLDDPSRTEQHLQFLVVGALLSGITWGNAWIMLPTQPGFLQLVVIGLWLAGLQAGAATTMATIREVFLAYSLPASIFLMGYILLSVVENSLLLAGAYLMYLGFILPIAYRISQDFNHTIELQLQNAELRDSLQAEEARLRDKEKELLNQRRLGAALETEKDSANEKLRAASDEKLLLLDAIGEGVLGVNHLGNITFTNASALKLLGYSESELLGLNILQFVSSEKNAGEADSAHDAVRDCFRKGQVALNMDSTLLGKNNQSLDVRLTCKPVTKDVEVIGAVVSFADVSKQKEMEAMLLQSQKMQAIGRLTGGVAHDFNNLLTVILGNLQFLQRHLKNDSKAESLLNRVMIAAKSGAELNNRLLSFSREQTLETEPVSVSEFLLETAEFLKHVLTENIDLIIEPAAEDHTVISDRTQLQNAILNLCVNAKDAMPNGGELRIDYESVRLPRSAVSEQGGEGLGDYVAISVTDTGTGMPPQVQEQIFDPFFSTKKKNRGTGLGLSTVYGFIRQSGGNITVSSEEGEGTQFKIYLPIATDVEPARTHRPSESREPLPHFDGKALVVEDDLMVREIAVNMLEETGFEVVSAANGREALRQLDTHPDIRLVFSDVVMPGELNGIDMAERILASKPGTPIILATGYTDKSLKDRLIESPYVSLLAKPYNSDKLASLISVMLSKASSLAKPPLDNGSEVLDLG